MWSNSVLSSKAFAPLQPSAINIVGIDTRSGYRIIVSNGIAQVVESSGEFEAATGDDDGVSGENAKRVPLKEMLQVLQGSGNALGRFVMTLNEMRDEELPPRFDDITWSKSDVDKALSGHKALEAKLVRDLNVTLGGEPLPAIRKSVLDRGIVIKVPVSLRVSSGESTKTVTGHILIPYQARFMTSVFTRLANKVEVNDSLIAGYYAEEAAILTDKPRLKENVRATLKHLVSDQEISAKIELPQRLLDATKIIVNDSLIESASSVKREGVDDELYDIKIELSEEGRLRLWQYSRDRSGTQLLLVVNGVAIAAPLMKGELLQSELEITKLTDRGLVDEAVTGINKAKGDSK